MISSHKNNKKLHILALCLQPRILASGFLLKLMTRDIPPFGKADKSKAQTEEPTTGHGMLGRAGKYEGLPALGDITRGLIFKNCGLWRTPSEKLEPADEVQDGIFTFVAHQDCKLCI